MTAFLHCWLLLLLAASAVAACYPSSHLCFAAKGFVMKTSAKKKKKSGAGFSSSSAARNSKGGITAVQADSTLLSIKAKKLLKKHGNDINAASTAYFNSVMQKLSTEEMGAGLADSNDLHMARVAATWDTVALFMPQDYARSGGHIDTHVDRRLRLIANACCESASNSIARSILDVGCGDGAIVPYLAKSGVVDLDGYVGVDVSSEMVRLAEMRNPGRRFRLGSFPDIVRADERFDCILFNGSLQFFRDTHEALAQASDRLLPGGRLVLAHVNGAEFVQRELRSNPRVVVRTMPNQVSLAATSGMLDLTITPRETLMTTPADPTDIDNDSFYLAVLEKTNL